MQGLTFRDLEHIFARPKLFCDYSGEALWNDPHVAQRLLQLHLQPDGEQISRQHNFIHRSAAWIREHFQLTAGRSVMDFGCGPGLYTELFAAQGAKVVGLDISSPAIDYARQSAQEKGLDIHYLRQNYLDYTPGENFDLLSLIYCDYCALSPAQRQDLLQRFKASLKSGGQLLFDVYSLKGLAQRQENSLCAHRLMDGFWSAQDYYGFVNTFIYPESKVAVDKYTLIEATASRVVYHWLQYFSPESLEQELHRAGFEIVSLYEDMCGAPFLGQAHSFTVQAQVKPS